MAIVLFATALFALNSFLAGAAAEAAEDRPIAAAVFDFEFVNWSQEVDYGAKNEAERNRLPMVSLEMRTMLEQSGRYRLLDLSSARADLAKMGEIHSCNGCDADIASELGADVAISGVVQKLSVLVQTIVITVRDAKTGHVIKKVQTDIRGNTDEAWKRGVSWLVRNRLLAD